MILLLSFIRNIKEKSYIEQNQLYPMLLYRKKCYIKLFNDLEILRFELDEFQYDFKSCQFIQFEE
jgi:hypothetical protein